MSNVAEGLAKRVVAAVAGAVSRPSDAPVAREHLKRVLVVRTEPSLFGAMGSVPLLRALREGLPDARVDALVSERHAAAIGGLGLAHEVQTFDRRRAARDPAYLMRLLFRLRGAGYDAVFASGPDDRFSTTPALLARLTAAPVRIGSDLGAASRFLTHVVPVSGWSVLERCAGLHLLSAVGVASRGIRSESRLGVGAAEGSLARTALDSVRSGFVAVVPAATVSTEATGVAVDAARREVDAGVVMVLPPGSQETRGDVASGGRSMPHVRVDDDGTFAAVLRRASLVVACGPEATIATLACEVPVVALLPERVQATRDTNRVRVVDCTVDHGKLRSAVERAAAQLARASASAAKEG